MRHLLIPKVRTLHNANEWNMFRMRLKFRAQGPSPPLHIHCKELVFLGRCLPVRHQHPHPPPQRGVLAKAGGPTQRFPEDEFASLALALLARPWSRVVHWIKKIRSGHQPWPAGKSPINGSFNSKIINKFNKRWIFQQAIV